MSSIGLSVEGPQFRCPLCGGGKPQRLAPVPAIACPRCGRPVADVSNVLWRVPLSAALVELLPESVARENKVLIYEVDGHELVIAADLHRTPINPELEWLAKLRFILNREIHVVHATQEAINFAIDRHYGFDDQSGGEGTIVEL
jgi:hypothetical protein